MKITLNVHQFVEEFAKVRPTHGFSREALKALFDHLTELERDLGEETEFDPIAICCDWTQYESAEGAAEAYGWKREDAEDERADTSDREALTFLCDQTTVLELSGGGVVVLNF